MTRFNKNHDWCLKVTSFLLIASLGACSPASETKPFSLPKRKPGTGLGLHGYNYTDLPIESYVVDGTGGGDVSVSVGQAGGSGTTCCMDAPEVLPTTYRVSWTRDGHRWCTLQVPFKGPVPDGSFNFNTHFYQDGHVEISISAETEPARVDLPSLQLGLKRHPTGNVINDDKFASCKDEP